MNHVAQKYLKKEKLGQICHKCQINIDDNLFHHLLPCICAKSFQTCPTLCAPMDYIACQAPLSIGFSRQEYWSRLPCPPPGDLPDPQIKPVSLRSPALAARFFTTRAIWETHLNTTMKSESRPVVTNSFRPHGLCSPWNSPGQYVWSMQPFPSPGDLPNQGSNQGLPHCRRILYHLSHKGSP